MQQSREGSSRLSQHLLSQRKALAPTAGLCADASFTLRFFARELTGTPNGFGLLAGTLLGGLLVIITELHLAEDAFALHFLLQSPKGLIDIVIANDDLHASQISGLVVIVGSGRSQNNPMRNRLESRIRRCSSKPVRGCPYRARQVHPYVFGLIRVTWPILRPGRGADFP